jgi:putative porin
MKKRLVWLGALSVFATTAAARDLEDILKEKHVIDAQEANEAKAAKEKAAAPALPSLPDWINKVTFSGDVRIRNEAFFQEGTESRNRDRFRLRFGAKAKPNDESELGFRLASGNANDPISNNQSFTDTFTFKNINISNAYLKLMPSHTLGWERPYVTLEGGKFDVPFYTTTSLMFDRDLTPEGFFEQFKAVETTDGVLRGLALNLGQWIYAENSNDGEGVTTRSRGGRTWRSAACSARSAWRTTSGTSRARSRSPVTRTTS